MMWVPASAAMLRAARPKAAVCGPPAGDFAWARAVRSPRRYWRRQIYRFEAVNQKCSLCVRSEDLAQHFERSVGFGPRYL